MKKVYEKPQVYMERFELSQNVAACNWKLGSGAPESCNIVRDNFEDDGADFTGGFTAEPLCRVNVSEYCYTSGAGDLPSIFVS